MDYIWDDDSDWEREEIEWELENPRMEPRWIKGDRVKTLDGKYKGEIVETPVASEGIPWYMVLFDGQDEPEIMREDSLQEEHDYEFEGPVPRLKDLDVTEEMADALWPDTIPWSDDEQNYYRRASVVDQPDYDPNKFYKFEEYLIDGTKMRFHGLAEEGGWEAPKM